MAEHDDVSQNSNKALIFQYICYIFFVHHLSVQGRKKSHLLFEEE